MITMSGMVRGYEQSMDLSCEDCGISLENNDMVDDNVTKFDVILSGAMTGVISTGMFYFILIYLMAFIFLLPSLSFSFHFFFLFLFLFFFSFPFLFLFLSTQNSQMEQVRSVWHHVVHSILPNAIPLSHSLTLTQG